jgi:hypothetical protein
VVSCFGETGTCHKSNIAGSNYSNFHIVRIFLLVCCKSINLQNNYTNSFGK